MFTNNYLFGYLGRLTLTAYQEELIYSLVVKNIYEDIGIFIFFAGFFRIRYSDIIRNLDDYYCYAFLLSLIISLKVVNSLFYNYNDFKFIEPLICTNINSKHDRARLLFRVFFLSNYYPIDTY